MSKKNIQIKELKIRMKGVPSQVARTSMSGLGNELLRKLTRRKNPLQPKQSKKIDDIDSGTLQISKAINTSQLSRIIARKITDSMVSKIRS